MDTETLLRRAYASFNVRDIDDVLELMHPNVDWPNGMEGGREVGHAAVRAYWTRQFAMIDSRVDPEAFARDDEGNIVVTVHQVVYDKAGTLLADTYVEHVYRIEDGLITRMDIR